MISVLPKQGTLPVVYVVYKRRRKLFVSENESNVSRALDFKNSDDTHKTARQMGVHRKKNHKQRFVVTINMYLRNSRIHQQKPCQNVQIVHAPKQKTSTKHRNM